MRTGRDAVCDECARRFYRAKARQRFCSPSCGVRYHNRRQKELHLQRRTGEQRRVNEAFRAALIAYASETNPQAARATPTAGFPDRR
jgi:hypothetical protein